MVTTFDFRIISGGNVHTRNLERNKDGGDNHKICYQIFVVLAQFDLSGQSYKAT